MADKKYPIRTCVACRQEFNKKDLLRIVRNKDGEIFIDESGKANGRGAYFCGRKECFAKLSKSKALDRAFKTSVPPEVYDAIGEVVLERGK
ncbi:MAG: YlxR family protein [Clostridia bacterium]|nr:YlxR family protein [Clostridia bacterium]